MSIGGTFFSRASGLIACVALAFSGLSHRLEAATGTESICAKVRIEIGQEVTLERQAFEARMTISNDLPEMDITEIQANILFQDENGSVVNVATSGTTPVNAKFFVDSIGKSIGPVASGTSGSLKWLIIPTQGAGGDVGNGRLYYVGATLSYSAFGRTEYVEVSPDFIFVKPQPNLTLDYFLPETVFGDDPMTQGVTEPVEPFTLGLRILNKGLGVAQSVSVTSGAPNIVSNEQQVIVDFSIKSAFVNDVPAAAYAVLSTGDLAPNAAATAGWQMEATLKGEIRGFNATYTHSDELGGSATTLIEDVSTHDLLGMVLVDLPGRDAVRDFLAAEPENGPVKVYESNGMTGGIPEATVVPGSAIFNNLTPTSSGSRWRISATPPTTPEGQFVWLRGPCPEGVPSAIRGATRIDGKILPKPNAWISRDSSGARYVNVFDTGVISNLTYDVEFGQPEGYNEPPIIGPLRNMFATPGVQLAFTVTATDPEGATPVLSAPLLPAGAALTGTGAFTWTPSVPQIGNYALTFQASDGIAATTKSMVVTVVGGDDTFLDAWKDRWFDENDENTGNGDDYDGDGLSNLLEYALDLDPTNSSVDKKPAIGRMAGPGGKTYLTLTYVHRTDDSSLTLKTVSSGDVNKAVESWDDNAVLVTGVPQGDLPPGMQRTTYRDSVALEDAGYRFLRLKVELTTP